MTKLISNLISDAQTRASKSSDKNLGIQVRIMSLVIEELYESLTEYAGSKHLMVQMGTAKQVVDAETKEPKPGWFMTDKPWGFENGLMAKNSLILSDKIIADNLPKELAEEAASQ
jgi:hypothetical protein